MYTAKIFHPEDLDEQYVSDSIEGHTEDFEVHESYLYSIGWSDSDDPDNDEAVWAVESMLYKATRYNVNCGHPQSFDPSELVDYKGHKVLVGAGPNMFASKETFDLIAKDTGIKLERWKSRGGSFSIEG